MLGYKTSVLSVLTSLAVCHLPGRMSPPRPYLTSLAVCHMPGRLSPLRLLSSLSSPFHISVIQLIRSYVTRVLSASPGRKLHHTLRQVFCVRVSNAGLYCLLMRNPYNQSKHHPAAVNPMKSWFSPTLPLTCIGNETFKTEGLHEGIWRGNLKVFWWSAYAG